MKFFCDIFDKKSSSIKEAANYLYCRKVLKSFFYMKNALEDLRIPLGYFSSL